MHVARHTDWGGKLNYPVNLVGGGGVTGGGEAEAADTGQAAGGGDREVFLASCWGRFVQASGSHVRTQQQTASPWKSCISDKMSIAVRKALSACGHECLRIQDMRVQK